MSRLTQSWIAVDCRVTWTFERENCTLVSWCLVEGAKRGEGVRDKPELVRLPKSEHDIGVFLHQVLRGVVHEL